VVVKYCKPQKSEFVPVDMLKACSASSPCSFRFMVPVEHWIQCPVEGLLDKEGVIINGRVGLAEQLAKVL
jgi:hypothetical protein